MLADQSSSNPPDGSTALGDVSGEKQQNNQDKTQDGSAVHLSWPNSSPQDPCPHLAPLRDNHSQYAAVAKTCFLLNQFVVNGSSATIEDTSCVDSSAVFHDTTFVETLSESFAALLECIGQHDDRRAKIVACKTAALVARASYARLRHSVLLFAIREPTNHRIEDEVCSDVPAALVSVALEDPDEGVAASAMSSLGILVLSTISTPGSLVDDELLSEILSMVNAGSPLAPFAPSLKDLVGEDPTSPLTELQSRIFDSTLAPRLMQLVTRFQSFENPSHVAMVLPTLTASLVYLAKVAPPMIFPLSQGAYSKRWVELDFVGLIETVVEGILFPLMQCSGMRGIDQVAAFSALRLVHACPNSGWVPETILWTVSILKDQYQATSCLETQMTLLGSLMIASRAIPLPERNWLLEFFICCLQKLPATTMAPHGIVSAGLLFEIGEGGKKSNSPIYQYRQPTRPAFLAEIALSLFLDGPINAQNTSGKATRIRSQSLVKLLKSTAIMAILKEGSGSDSGGDASNLRMREEMIASFCIVAFQVGRRHKFPEEGDGPHLIARQPELVEWLLMSIALLNSFGACLGWGGSPPYIEEEMTMLVACQASYTRLLQEVVHGAGLLGSSSVTMNMTSVSVPPNILWDQMEQATDYLAHFEPMPTVESMIEPIGKLLDEIVKKEMKGSGIVSHHMRLFLLSIAADQWVQTRSFFSSKSKPPGVTEHSMNAESAKQLLVAISPRRMFRKVVESNKPQVESYSKSKKERYKKYAQDMVMVCVACIENIALMVCEYAKTFGNSNDTKMILNASVVSLQGKSGGDSDAAVLPVCQAAIERIQAAFQSSQGNGESVSPLIPAQLNRRPVMSSTRITQGREAFNEGYIVHLSRQIVRSRANRCILSVPAVYTYPAAIREPNWLRLSLPPQPESRGSMESSYRIEWGSNVMSCTSGSDPIAVTLAHSIRRNLRYDGMDEYKLMIAMRIHNLVAAEIPSGVRLELGISEEDISTSDDSQDNVSVEVHQSLAEGFEDGVHAATNASTVAVYKNALKGGDHLTWEITKPIYMNGTITLKPSIMYRAMEKELPHGAWVAADTKKDDEDGSVISGLSQKSGGSNANGEDGVGDSSKLSMEEKENIVIPCQPILLSPFVGLQPCPFVFYCDRRGDIDGFRFLWSRMPCQMTPLKLMPTDRAEVSPSSHDTLHVSIVARLAFDGDPVPGGMITQLWAFMSLQGKRAMFVLAEQGSDKSTTLHSRGDDQNLLLCLAGTSTSRNVLVSALLPGMTIFHQQVHI